MPLAHRGALSGMADFSASITQGPVASNPYRTGEQDGFSFLATQRTSISGVQSLGVNVSQESETNLVASFHKPLPGVKDLNLTLDPETQNYRYFLIEDVENSKTDLAYDRLGNLSQASRTESSVLSTRVKTYAKGQAGQRRHAAHGLVTDEEPDVGTARRGGEAQRKGLADSSKVAKDAKGSQGGVIMEGRKALSSRAGRAVSTAGLPAGIQLRHVHRLARTGRRRAFARPQERIEAEALVPARACASVCQPGQRSPS